MVQIKQLLEHMQLEPILLDTAGATAIEYGLIAALIAIAAIAAMSGLSNQIDSTFNVTSSSLSSANAA